MVLTRKRQIGKCNCKVGACRKCGSQCKRCKCSCDGVSPLEALNRSRGAQKGRKKTRNCAKRKSMDEMIVREPMLEKRLRKCQDGSGIDDESEFVPTRSVIATDLSFESAIHNASNDTNTVSGSGNKDSTDEFWGNLNIPFDTVIELQKIIKTVPKTRTMKTLEEFIDKVVDDHLSQVDTPIIQVF